MLLPNSKTIQNPEHQDV